MSEHTIEELEAMLEAAKAKAAHQEFPKWVEVHGSHVDTTNGHTSVPLFADHHIGRDGTVTVLVRDAHEEARATSAK